jgi:hypothetical protein
VISDDHDARRPLYLPTVYAKARKETSDEKKTVRKLVGILKTGE